MLFFILILFTLLLSSCNQRKNIVGNGDILSVEYIPNIDVDGIRVTDIRMVNGKYIVPVEVNIYDSVDKKIVISGQKAIVDSIDVSQSLGQISITGKSNVNYITDEFIVDIYGYSLSSLRFQLSTINAQGLALANDVFLDLDYASDFYLDEFVGRSFKANLKSKSILSIKSLDLSSSLSLNMKEESNVKIEGVRSQDFKATLDNASNLDIVSDSIENTIFTMNSKSIIAISGKAKSVDLIMTDSTYNGKNCISNYVAINVGYGKSIVDVKALDSITVNSAIGDCNVTYYGDMNN